MLSVDTLSEIVLTPCLIRLICFNPLESVSPVVVYRAKLDRYRPVQHCSSALSLCVLMSWSKSQSAGIRLNSNDIVRWRAWKPHVENCWSCWSKLYVKTLRIISCNTRDFIESKLKTAWCGKSFSTQIILIRSSAVHATNLVNIYYIISSTTRWISLWYSSVGSWFSEDNKHCLAINSFLSLLFERQKSGNFSFW